jgi:hypothetical protein
MSTMPAERSSAARMTRHRERRRQGTRCVTVDVSKSERDSLVVRGYLSEEDRDNGAAIKKAIEGVLSIWCSSFSPKLLSAVELASDRSIRRNASQIGAPSHALRVTAVTTGRTQRRHASQDCPCRCVRNSSLTSTREAFAGVWDESSIRR